MREKNQELLNSIGRLMIPRGMRVRGVDKFCPKCGNEMAKHFRSHYWSWHVCPVCGFSRSFCRTRVSVWAEDRTPVDQYELPDLEALYSVVRAIVGSEAMKEAGGGKRI